MTSPFPPDVALILNGGAPLVEPSAEVVEAREKIDLKALRRATAAELGLAVEGDDEAPEEGVWRS